MLIKIRRESRNSNTPPQAEAKISTSPSLTIEDFSNEGPMDLVNMSAV